jgi:nucleotide-binding universal stress UspA family protein
MHMTYKSILTILTNPAEAELAISSAARLARELDAHLDILALGIDRTQIGYSYLGASPIMIEAGLERAAEDAKAIEKAANAAIAEQFSDLRYSVESMVTQLGMVNDIAAGRARFADLVVQPRPYGIGAGVEAEAVIEAVLFGAQAPVLVLPETGLGENTLPKRIVLAWNQSNEAMTATRSAMPFLKGAESVSITVVDPQNLGDDRSDPGGMLCQMLVRHKVHADVAVLARTQSRVSDVLARHASDLNADMLVMGAYGHSRFRQAILGGATRNMLENAKIPVLMAH